MDSNGQRFWLAYGGTPWSPEQPGTLETLPHHLRLASRTLAPSYPEIPAEAEARLALVPMARDAYGTRAFVTPDALNIRATGAFPQPEATDACPLLLPAPAPEPITDLALNPNGHLYYATPTALRLHPLRDRFSPQAYTANGLTPWRIACAPDSTVWILDRTHRQLARLTGLLWPEPLEFTPPPDPAFLPVEPNPNPPQLTVLPSDWLQPDEDPVALAVSPEGQLAVLLWTPSEARVRWVDDRGQPGPLAILQPVLRPYSIAWISPDRFVVLCAGVDEAIAYSWREGLLSPSGDILPLRAHDGGPFLQRVTSTVEYGSRQPTPDLPNHVAPRPLVAIAQSSLTRDALGTLATPLDSGLAATAWHRLYVEAHLPAGTSFTLFATATDEAEAPNPTTHPQDWHPHHFGFAPPTATPHEPLAAWMSQPSEIPGQPGFTGRPPEPNQNGLFTVLLQRSNRRVRTLRGRFLHLRIELRGNLRATPCLHALRAYAPRFSYQDRYLPALFREDLFGPEADTTIPPPGKPSTRADFLGRFLANFEGLLTPLEDSVADSWLLTDPTRTPAPALDWLASWIGVSFAPWFPSAQRRLHLAHTPELYRRRGTLRGLELALDIATAGGLRQGRILVVEDFWFRRTLQTVLGLRLDREDDPLLGGPTLSGNSKVGNTLFLGEEGVAKKFLALFDANLDLPSADPTVVDDFFASLAHRVTIIVHQAASTHELDLVTRIAALEAPAHVIVRTRTATADFMVGLSALLGVDTYLRPRPSPDPVEIDKTTLADGSLLSRPLALDPRLTGAS